MAESTGPILAIGAITMANRSVFHDKPVEWRAAVATGIAAVAFAGAEKIWSPGVRMLAWTALVAVCFTRIEADVPSPVESALSWWDGGAPNKSGAGGGAVKTGGGAGSMFV